MDDRLIRSKYQSAKDALSNVNVYEPVDLRAFAPDEKRAWHKYYRNLRLPFAVEVFEKSHGNNQEKVMIAWRIPELLENRCQTKSNLICHDLIKHLPQYQTRAMIKKAHHNVKWLKNIKRSHIVDLYRCLSGNMTEVPDNSTFDIISNKINQGSNHEEISEVIEASCKDRKGEYYTKSEILHLSGTNRSSL